MTEANEINGGKEKKEKKEKKEREKDGAADLGSGNGAKIHCLSIVGQIEGHYLLGEGQKATKYEHLLPELTELEESGECGGVLILINTVGGDVEAGLAIAELIAGMSKPTASLVLGGGHSIGIPLAVAAKRSFIVPSATMTLHPVRYNGLVISAPQTYRYFDRMQERILDFITAHSRAEASVLRGMMMRTDDLATDIGTVLEGKEAVDVGLIDALGGLRSALDALRGMMK